jgi:hypothetical protein
MTNLKDKIVDKPFAVFGVVSVILIWMMTPLIAQKYFEISAIAVSFSITVIYFISWKIYENREKILEIFP